MEPLKERIKKRVKWFKNVIRTEKAIEDVITTIQNLTSQEVIGSVYEQMAMLYVYLDDVEELESSILPSLSEVLKCKWEKRIDKQQVSYDTSFWTNGVPVYLTIHCKPTNSCQIIAVPTGKTKVVTRTIQVEEPEFEYIIDCGGDKDE